VRIILLVSMCHKKLNSSIVGTFQAWLLGFSAVTNTKRLLDCSSPKKGQITCLNGIRFWSMCWVLVSHVYQGLDYFGNSKNRNDVGGDKVYLNVIAFKQK